MGSNMSNDEMPPQPKTTQLPQVPEWAIELTRSVKGGFAAVNDRLDGLERTDKTLADKVSDMSVDIRQLRDADVRHEDEFRRLSVRTKDTSANASSASLEHEAKLGLALADLAEERAKREALEKTAATKKDVEEMLTKAAEEQTTAIVVGVKTVMATPTAQKLKNAIVPVLMVAIAIIGVKLTLVLNKLQETPAPPTVVQLAPVTVYADAGADR
jgi:hypothetical protein